MKTLMALMAAVVTALFLSSCSSPAATSGDGHADHQHGAEPTSAPNNAADVAFVSDMIPHHEQAVAMSALVPDRSTDPAVIGLAATISAEQGPEIETMKGFLKQWNAGADVEHGGHGSTMEGMQMPGMVDEPTMSRLQSLKGPEFDRLFLESMIGHHEGAISMANAEIADGANADAKELAKRIVTAQQAEIGQMKKMLAG
jgi:uncharacterized protein (DUF305 family)